MAKMKVETKCSLMISSLLASGAKNCSSKFIPFYAAMSDLEIREGLIARMKNN